MINISFCTAVRNRLTHLKETLPANIRCNQKYPSLQFLILDYNSSDGLEQWINSEFQAEISAGRLIYFKTNEPWHFDRSHSRNMMFRLAGGEILCNIDADNFTGDGFAKYVAERFENEEDIFLTSNSSAADFIGRICFRKSDFCKLRGFDETMTGYGFEDIDFINRMSMLGLKRRYIEGEAFYSAISHADLLRISEDSSVINLKWIFISYISETVSDIIIFYKDFTYDKGQLIHTANLNAHKYTSVILKDNYEYDFNLRTNQWTSGKWEYLSEEVIALQPAAQTYHLGKGVLRSQRGRHIFYHISDPEIIQTIMLFHSQLINRNKMKENLAEGLLTPNKNYGNGNVNTNDGSVLTLS